MHISELQTRCEALYETQRAEAGTGVSPHPYILRAPGKHKIPPCTQASGVDTNVD